MRPIKFCLASGLFFAAVLFSVPACAEYGYFSDVQSGSDIVMKEVRWPYWNSAYYNTWWSDSWTSSDGVGGYWYNGLALPAAGSPNPVGTQQTVNWSFWPLSSPLNITDTITPFYTGPSTFAGANYLAAVHDTTVQPFIGYLWRRGDFFLHGFTAIDVPTSIARVGATGTMVGATPLRRSRSLPLIRCSGA